MAARARWTVTWRRHCPGPSTQPGARPRRPSPWFAGTCSPGCSTAGCADAGWSRPGPTARRHTAARHGHTSAMAPDPARPKNTYIREDRLLLHLPALYLLLSSPATRGRRRTRAGADVRTTVSPGEVIAYLREHRISLMWNPADATLQARAPQTATTATVTAR